MTGRSSAGIRRTIRVLLVAALAAGCTPADDTLVELRGRATAGPVCPVVTDPPDPACEDRPVEGAVIVAHDGSGAEVARTRTAADGTFVLRLPAGRYRIEASPVEGLLGTPPSMEVTIAAGIEPEAIELAYDTGIR